VLQSPLAKYFVIERKASMLGLVGVHLHPGLRALIGAAVLAVGLAGHAAFLTVVGAAIGAWGVAALVVGLGRSRR
jgi:hypothetical protein